MENSKLSPEVNASVYSGTRLSQLTKRELEILRLTAEGFSMKQIADTLNLASATVDTHSRSITAKLCARNMKQAIAEALRKKIIR